jgi:hypothetical protein
MTALHDVRTIARAMGGQVVGGKALVPGPGYSPRDRSLSWLVLGPRGHGWTHGDRHSATTDAEWLARTLGVPIRSTDGTQ